MKTLKTGNSCKFSVSQRFGIIIFVHIVEALRDAIYHFDKPPPSLKLKTKTIYCWVCLVFRLFEQNGRSCQKLTGCRKSSEKKCAEEDIKKGRFLWLGPEEPFRQQVFKRELRKGTLTLWNALHIAAVTLLPFNLGIIHILSRGWAIMISFLLRFIFWKPPLIISWFLSDPPSRDIDLSKQNIIEDANDLH